MKTITIEQGLKWHPCYSEKKIRRIAKGKTEWTAIEILALEKVPAQDRLWVVLREELIDAPVLHEFACRCAERALSGINNPDPRSVAAIAAKRAWLRGEIDDDELDATWAAAWAADRAAWWAAEDTDERRWQIEELKRMLEEAEHEQTNTLKD